MKRIAPHRLLTLAVALFFLAGAWANLMPTEATAAEYAAWGYPRWFSYVTGSLELFVAVLLAFGRTRIVGVVIGGVVMGAAFLTLVAHGEYTHALAPLAVLAALGGVFVLARRVRPVATLREFR
ncbi:DoxX family protein [Erythrobacter westpacificensis]